MQKASSWAGIELRIGRWSGLSEGDVASMGMEPGGGGIEYELPPFGGRLGQLL